MIELRQVGKSYGSATALHPLDLRIDRGVTILIGPSGCGKSTLLRLMIGLVAPDAGEVRFEGQPLSRDNLLNIRRRMGYVIQEGGLFPHLSARGNVALLPRHVGWSRARTDERITALADLVHLSPDRLDLLPHQLSGGQRQRVALMRALALDPDVLLLDEPLGALDPMIRRELQRDLREAITRLSKTVVMVTHDIAEAAYFGDAVVLLRAGRVVQAGSWRDLLDSPADPYVTAFINAQRVPAFLREPDEATA